ncbi:hypothetical protein Tco_0056070 [Tanacetum coccineum]
MTLLTGVFLKRILVEFGFHDKMVHWIMQCVSTTGFTINVNGERVGYFKGGRGLRDTIYAEVIKRDLDEFCASSGMLPNSSKSTIFFGSLCDMERDAITNILPFATGKLPVRYLGVPLISKRLSIKDCGSLINRIRSKVNNYKNRSLSYAGKLQLIAVVLESVHVYWASIFLLPTTIINKINKLLKWFF